MDVLASTAPMLPCQGISYWLQSDWSGLPSCSQPAMLFLAFAFSEESFSNSIILGKILWKYHPMGKELFSVSLSDVSEQKWIIVNIPGLC